MSHLSRLAPRDLDALSAYADGALSASERIAVEQRLEREPVLREALKEIRTTSALLRALPPARPPRNFTLTPEMAGVRSGWLRTPFLQLATAVAVVAFVVTVGVDVFGGMVPGAALRAAAPAQELAMEAPAEFAAADALESGAIATPAETAIAEKTAAEEPSAVAAAPMEWLAGTPTAGALAEDTMNREAPTVGGAIGMQTAPTLGATVASALEVQPTASGECEVCGPDLVLPTGESDRLAAATPAPDGDAGTEVAAAQVAEPLAPEGTAVMEESAGQLAPPPAAEPAAPPASEERLRVSLPAVRWIEIGLGGVALVLGVITLWARRRGR